METRDKYIAFVLCLRMAVGILSVETKTSPKIMNKALDRAEDAVARTFPEIPLEERMAMRKEIMELQDELRQLYLADTATMLEERRGGRN